MCRFALLSRDFIELIQPDEDKWGKATRLSTVRATAEWPIELTRNYCTHTMWEAITWVQCEQGFALCFRKIREIPQVAFDVGGVLHQDDEAVEILKTIIEYAELYCS